MSSDEQAARKEADRLAKQLLGDKLAARAEFVRRVTDTLARAREKEFLVIHNPGGWGNTRLDLCLDWERSIVNGVCSTLDEMGHSWVLTQYFRSGDSFWRHMLDIKKEAVFFLKGRSFKARVMAAELRFLTEHLPDLTILLLGASQGAAFANTVMRELGGASPKVYSIELGIFFPHMSRRVLTERTLAIDSNGMMPDPMAHRDLWAGSRAYAKAFFRWFWYRLKGRPTRFTNCINVPGHEYSWEYPEVHRRIEAFLKANFGTHRGEAGGGVR
jgi:hypothetical protein